MKKVFKLKKLINKDIKLGDKVFLNDGSALTCDATEDAIYIVCSYENLTGIDKELRDIEATVISINIDDSICMGHYSAYLQDIEIQIGKGVFRTASELVYKSPY